MATTHPARNLFEISLESSPGGYDAERLAQKAGREEPNGHYRVTLDSVFTKGHQVLIFCVKDAAEHVSEEGSVSLTEPLLQQ